MIKRFELEEIINKLELYKKTAADSDSHFFYENSIENVKAILKLDCGVFYGVWILDFKTGGYIMEEESTIDYDQKMHEMQDYERDNWDSYCEAQEATLWGI